MTLRPSAERGVFQLGWLDSKHTFSFNRYFDPNHMQYRSMRVLNEDVVAPAQGFGLHPHENMEILTWVLSGRLKHHDDSGGSGILGAGELQQMTAGTGIWHSEFNASATDPVHFFQIWIFPDRQGLTPAYEQRAFPASERQNRFQRIASASGAEGALVIHQDAEVFALDLASRASVDYVAKPERGIWIQLASGALRINGQPLAAGDGLAATGASSLEISASEDAHLLLLDLA